MTLLINDVLQMQTSEADQLVDFSGMLRSVRCFFPLTKDVFFRG